MPWNNQGGGGPWGQGPLGGGRSNQQQPDLEEMLKRGQDRFKQAMPGGGRGSGGGIFASLLIMIAVGVASFYSFAIKVGPDEVGIVLRFGKYDRQLSPGLNFRLPYPVEEVYLPQVTRVNQINIGMREGVSRRTGKFISNVPEESLMLTGDENIIDADFTVLWKIREPEQFLFNIQDPVNTIKVVAESSMREVVGQSKVQDLLTKAKAETELAAHDLIQKVLDSYRAGVQITEVKLQKVDPPAEVIDAFRDVQAARADMERLQNKAEAHANKIIPEARGSGEQIKQAAMAYRDKVVAEAKGQADRFNKIYSEYKKAKTITRQRMFLETMEQILSKTDKVIIDNNGSNGSGVVPYLPLSELGRAGSGSAKETK
jgi:membrane protease subunit HflK